MQFAVYKFFAYTARMTYPFHGTFNITQGFMQPNAALLGGYHKGVDWDLPHGTNVCAIDSGVVIATGVTNKEGRYIAVRHEWGESQYYHLSKVLVKTGDKVFEGVDIALSGDSGVVTGPHLHLQTWKAGTLVNPISLIGGAPVAVHAGYVVPSGGSLSQAAKDMGVSLDELLNANPQYKQNPNFVHAGATLIRPSAKQQNTYVVKAGDSLWKIGLDNGQSVAQLLDKNPQYKSNPRLIRPGDKINL